MKNYLVVFVALCLLAVPAWTAPAGFDPAAIAEEEALRRQERKLVLDANLARAKQLQKDKDFTNAAKLYRRPSATPSYSAASRPWRNNTGRRWPG